MKVLLALLTLLFLSSCVSVYFTDPQPAGGTRLNSVPEELWGSWMTEDNEHARFDAAGIHTWKIKTDSLTLARDSTYEGLLLSDTFRLYQARQWYVLNYRSSNSPWEIIVIRKNPKGDICLYENRDPDFFVHDRNLKLEHAHFTLGEMDTIVNELHPALEDSFNLSSATFSGQMQLKTIKRIAREEHLITLLRSDGSIYTPSDENE